MPQDLISILFSWALLLSGYEGPKVPPNVELVETQFFIENACSKESKTCNVLGWYPSKGNIVYIHKNLNMDSLLNASIVVHEMVHYIQGQGGAFKEDHSCKYALEKIEREAYKVQREFLLQNGVYGFVGTSLINAHCEE